MAHNTKRCIIWLEDNFHEDELTALGNYIESKQEYEVVLRLATGIQQLRRHLDEAEKEGEVISGIILDIIVHGMTNLAPFGRPDIRWSKGAADAGNKLIKYIFRSKQKTSWIHLSETPILVLSVKVNIKEEEYSEFGKNIKVIQKYETLNWVDGVKKWIDKTIKC